MRDVKIDRDWRSEYTNRVLEQNRANTLRRRYGASVNSYIMQTVVRGLFALTMYFNFFIAVGEIYIQAYK